MIIGGMHWLVAVGIAIAVHLAGMLWLSLPAPARQPLADRTSESIVVTVGPNASRAAAEAEALRPDDGALVAASAATAATAPEAAKEASPPAAPDAGPEPAVMDLEAVDSAAPVEPDAARGTTTPEPASVEPEWVASNESGSVETLEPETVAARPASGSEPAAPDIVDARAGVQELAEPETVEATPDQPEAAEIQAKAAPRVAVPTAFADDTPVPEPSGSTVSVEPAATVTGAAPDAAAGLEPAPDIPARAEEASTVPADQPVATPGIESAEIESAAEPGMEAAAVRQPAPAVEFVSEPDVSEAAEPEIIDLQALQESGAGVAARYAGVLKGWLQKNMHYPRAARLAGQEGEVVVHFVIDRDGKVQSIRIESKSGFPLLDREAREMIERGDPFPAMPDDMPGQQLEVRVPVDFHVRDETLTKEIPPIYLE